MLLIALLSVPAHAEPTGGFILDPSGIDTTRVIEPKGMSWIRPARRRTPTGFLYPYPLEPQTLLALDEEWKGGASLDIGGLATTGDDDETRFWRYADWGSNFLLNSFRLTFLQERKGLYAEARGGAVGREDQFYSAEFSWLGRARLRGSFSGLPRAYARDARSLYEGLGSDTLTLLPGLTAGGPGSAGETDAALISKLETVGESHLSVQRNQGQVEFERGARGGQANQIRTLGCHPLEHLLGFGLLGLGVDHGHLMPPLPNDRRHVQQIERRVAEPLANDHAESTHEATGDALGGGRRRVDQQHFHRAFILAGNAANALARSATASERPSQPFGLCRTP